MAKCEYSHSLSNSVVKATAWGLQNIPMSENPFAKSTYVDDGEPVIYHRDAKGRVTVKIRIVAEIYTYSDEGE